MASFLNLDYQERLTKDLKVPVNAFSTPEQLAGYLKGMIVKEISYNFDTAMHYLEAYKNLETNITDRYIQKQNACKNQTAFPVFEEKVREVNLNNIAGIANFVASDLGDETIEGPVAQYVDTTTAEYANFILSRESTPSASRAAEQKQETSKQAVTKSVLEPVDPTILEKVYDTHAPTTRAYQLAKFMEQNQEVASEPFSEEEIVYTTWLPGSQQVSYINSGIFVEHFEKDSAGNPQRVDIKASCLHNHSEDELYDMLVNTYKHIPDNLENVIKRFKDTIAFNYADVVTTSDTSANVNSYGAVDHS